jgi:hypothetical protein
MAEHIDIDEGAAQQLVREPGVIDELFRVGQEAAAASAVAAPHRTGAGAASIHAELTLLDRTPEVRVSWDREHYYMYFHQKGTRYMFPHPFMTYGVSTAGPEG